MAGDASDEPGVRTRIRSVVTAAAVFLIAAYVPDLLEAGGLEDPLRGVLDSYFFLAVASIQVLVCTLGVLGLARRGLAAAVEELGLDGAPLPALGFGLAATMPMLVGIGVTSEFNAEISQRGLLRVALVAPIAEEVMFRGFLFRQLYTRGRFAFWSAAILVALVFGLGHVWQAVAGQTSLGGLAGIVLVTAIGSLLFSWLFVRWGLNLWVPIALHALMNLWWEVFAVGATALGSTTGNVTRLMTIVAAIGLTLWLTPAPEDGPPAP